MPSNIGNPANIIMKTDSEALLQTVNKNLERVEELIYLLEETYLRETAVCGNIVKGFANTKLSMVEASYAGSHKKHKINEADRIFSLSSCTSKAYQHLKREGENSETKNTVSAGQINSHAKARSKNRTRKFIHAPRQLKEKLPRPDGGSQPGGSAEMSEFEPSHKLPAAKRTKYNKNYAVGLRIQKQGSKTGPKKKIKKSKK